MRSVLSAKEQAPALQELIVAERKRAVRVLLFWNKKVGGTL